VSRNPDKFLLGCAEWQEALVLVLEASAGPQEALEWTPGGIANGWHELREAPLCCDADGSQVPVQLFCAP
jgi:hypothetical protein